MMILTAAGMIWENKQPRSAHEEHLRALEQVIELAHNMGVKRSELIALFDKVIPHDDPVREEAKEIVTELFDKYYGK